MLKTIRIAAPIEFYSDEDETLFEVIQAAKELFPNSEIEIDPIFVSSKELIGFIKMILPEKINNIRNDIHKDFEDFVKKQFDKRNLKPPENIKTLESFTESRRSQTYQFISYVNQKKYDYVLMQTSSKKWMNRILDGSFTEALVRNSKTPILCINKNTRVYKPKKAFIPLELNEKSRIFTLDFIKSDAAQLFQKIEFYHSIRIPDFDDISWSVSPYNKESYDYSGMIDRAEKKVASFMENLIQEVANYSQAQFTYSCSKKIAPLDEEIMVYAKKADADMIVLRSNLYPVHIPFLGTNTMSVLNQSNLPTLTYPLFSQNEKFFL